MKLTDKELREIYSFYRDKLFLLKNENINKYSLRELSDKQKELERLDKIYKELAHIVYFSNKTTYKLKGISWYETKKN